MNAPDPAAERRWKPTADELMASIAKVSAERRADCPSFVAEFVEVYAAELSPPELDRKWVELVGEFPWYAEDLLHCADETLKKTDPVPEIVCDVAQIEADGGQVVREITTDEWHELGRRWLQDLVDRFRPVFDRLSSS